MLHGYGNTATDRLNSASSSATLYKSIYIYILNILSYLCFSLPPRVYPGLYSSYE